MFFFSTLIFKDGRGGVPVIRGGYTGGEVPQLIEGLCLPPFVGVTRISAPDLSEKTKEVKKFQDTMYT